MNQKGDALWALTECLRINPYCNLAASRLAILKSMLTDEKRPHPRYVGKMLEPELVHVDSAREATEGGQSESTVLNELNLPPQEVVSDDGDRADDEWDTVDDESYAG